MSATADAVSSYQEEAEEEKPLPAYLGLMALYNTFFAGLLVLATRSGRRLPERVGTGDMVLFAVATFRLSRIITRAKVTSTVRAPFTEGEEAIGDAEVMGTPKGSGMRLAIGELLSCPFCISQWIATALIGGLLFAPRVTRLLATVFGIVALSDFLQYGREYVRKKAEG